MKGEERKESQLVTTIAWGFPIGKGGRLKQQEGIMLVREPEPHIYMLLYRKVAPQKANEWYLEKTKDDREHRK